MSIKNNGWIGKIVASILAVMLLGFAAPSALAADEEDACAAELRAEQAFIEANQADLTFAEAVQHLLANAPSCDFDVEGSGDDDAGDAKVWSLDDVGVTSFADVTSFVCTTDCEEGDSSSTETSSSSEVVGCAIGGAGPGTVTGQILGIQLLEEPGAGTWEPQNGVIEVTGEAATVGGTQIERLGEIRVLKTLPIPANEGSTGATCLKTIKTSTDVTRRCWAIWFFVVIIYCEEKVTTDTEVILQPCTGSATQILSLPVILSVESDSRLGSGGTDVIRVEHAYAEDPNPCEAAAAIASAFR